MPGSEPQSVERRELELTHREAELARREARLVRAARERNAELDAREERLARREQALATLAAELTAERECQTALRAELRAELQRVERRRAQTSPRWFAAPASEASAADEEWWAKVLGRSGHTAA